MDTSIIGPLIMPIIQITNFEKIETEKKTLNISRETQEYNFMLMLNNIDFSEPSISTWQNQEIFRCTFRNKFFEAINFLLAQEAFCQKLMPPKNDLMTIAFSCVSLPEYCDLLNSILNNHNMLTIASSQINNTVFQLKMYINFIQSMRAYRFDCINCIKNDYKSITVLWDIINSVLGAKPEQQFILNYLIIMQNIQDTLMTENDKLLQNNFELQANVSTLTHQLADLNLKHLALQTHQQEHLNSKYLVLKYELEKDQQTCKESINSKQEIRGYNSSASLRRHSL
jgi:hypothetical protein